RLSLARSTRTRTPRPRGGNQDQALMTSPCTSGLACPASSGRMTVITLPDRNADAEDLGGTAGFLAMKSRPPRPCESRRIPVSTSAVEQHRKPHIPGDQALRIADADAATAYRDLSGYRITISLERDGWHIEYRLKSPTSAGGGPQYVIDAASGAIL